jgi:hypothetical protein
MMRLLVFVLLLFPALEAQYLGFDRNEYPGDRQLQALRKTFSFAGYWLNDPPGAKTNTWAGKREVVAKAGFGFLVLYTGKTYAQLKGNEAEELGAADGQGAIEIAKKEGFPAGTILFLDQEEGGRLLDEQKAYLFAWIDAVIAGGYRVGVYCSGIAATEKSGEKVITADDIRKNAGDREIAYFIANDACPPSSGCVFPKQLFSARDSGLDYADVWQYVQSPRRPDFTQSCASTYAADGNCHPPEVSPGSHLHVDVEVATEADPSHGRSGGK